VIVNHSHKFIFVHVPKAAGTSVSELFSKFSAYSDLEVGGTELGEALQNAYKRRFGLTKHSTAEEIRAIIGEDTWRSYYSFAFVRDPYARAQSTFHFMKRWHGNKEMKQLSFMDEHPDFRSFVMSDTFLKQKAHRLLWPQARWLLDEAGNVMVNQVGRLESLDEDIHKILSTAPGLVAAGAAPESAPAKNKSASTDAALFELLSSDAEVENRIYEAYKIDFELFGYARFDKATAAPPRAERTPDVAPIVSKAAAPSGRGAQRPAQAPAQAPGPVLATDGNKGNKGNKLNKKSLSSAKLNKLNKMIKGDKVGAAKKDAA